MCRPTTGVDGQTTRISAWGVTRSFATILTASLLAVFVCHIVWFHSYLGTRYDVVDIVIICVAIASSLWAFFLAGAHYKIEIIGDRLIVARCWYWKATKLPDVHKKQCLLVIAPCRLHARYGPWRGYWIELVLPKSRERLVLACYDSEDKTRAAADELHRATGIPFCSKSLPRYYAMYYPVIPRPRLARLLITRFILR